MAQKYYDSQYSGRQIDIAVQTAVKVAEVAKTENAGKILQIDETGEIIPADAPEVYDDTALSGRVQNIEARLAELLDATGVEF